MLFGRKNSPIGSPKPESADAAGSAAPDRGFADTTAPLSTAPISAAPASVTPGSAASTAPAPAASPSAPMPSPAPAAYRSPYADKGPEMTTSTPKPPIAPSIPGAGLRTDTPRRVVDIPGAPVRRPDAGAPLPGQAPAAAAAPAPGQDQQRRLTVGRDISLSGEITSCDVLVVEGTVEAKLRDGRNIEIAETGLFKGSVEIDEADIGGRFEGDITVRGRLRVRSTGKITGSIKYGELEVEAGGRLIGDIQAVEPGANVARIATPAPAAPVELPVAPVSGAAE